jgi:long-subunit acyl-CoA synthetase (AMP-forming)
MDATRPSQMPLSGPDSGRKPFSTVLGMYIPVLAQLADSFVLSKVRAATGGRLRVALSGG